MNNLISSVNKEQLQSCYFSFVEIVDLKDRFGRSICWGDILADEFNNLLTPVVEIEKGEHILFFKPLKHLKSKLHMGCKSTYSNTLTVIGNIYDKRRK